MAITSIGYDGPITEPGMASLLPNSGSSIYGVVGAGDWKVTAHPSTAQAVNIAVGQGWGPAVIDKTDAIVTVQCDPISSGTRWDLIAVHRDWTPPGGATSFIKINGTPTKQLPPRDNNPGVKDDQPLALVQWTAGQTQPTAVVDLRIFAANGGAVALDTLVTSFVGRVGSRLKISGDMWSCELDANGSPVWVNEDAPGAWVNLTPANGWTLYTGRCRKVSRGSQLQIELDARYGGTNGPVSQDWGVASFPAGYAPAESSMILGLTNGYSQPGQFWATSTGIKVGAGNTGPTVQILGTVALR